MCSVHVEFDFLQVFLWTLPGLVVVVEITVSATQLLDVVVVRPPLHLVSMRANECKHN